MDPEATRLEKQHVHDVYENTAPCFSGLQSKAWPRVRQFLLDQRPGSLIADIGCGTGKYLKVNSQVHTLGCDYCASLVEIARNRGCEVMVCDNLNLPFRDQGFDAIISIGVVHHFSTKQRRIQAIKEMARVLVPGGQLMVYVWAMEQKNRHFEKQDVLVPWNRALCSRLSGTEWHPRTSRGCHPAGSGCLKQRCDSKRSHSVDDGAGVAGGCCRGSAKEGEDGDGFYHTLGRSFRSWFFSRSLDESTLRKQIERVKNPEGWVNSTVSIQPSRHPSLDWEPQELFSTKDPNSDEEMLIETSSQKHLDGLRSGGTSKNLSGGERRRKEARHFADITNPSENCVGAGDPGEGDPSTSKLLRRVSAEGDPVDSRAFMRYYHVFREGELEHLLRENVAELRILSSGNDHGNWCVIAQKREGCDSLGHLTPLPQN